MAAFSTLEAVDFLVLKREYLSVFFFSFLFAHIEAQWLRLVSGVLVSGSETRVSCNSHGTLDKLHHLSDSQWPHLVSCVRSQSQEEGGRGPLTKMRLSECFLGHLISR